MYTCRKRIEIVYGDERTQCPLVAVTSYIISDGFLVTSAVPFSSKELMEALKSLLQTHWQPPSPPALMLSEVFLHLLDVLSIDNLKPSLTSSHM